MKCIRPAIAGLAVAALVPLTATAALAAPPSNDRPGGAVALSLGQTVNEDTTEATTGTFDAKANQFCGAPYTNASVWFSYAPSADGAFILDMSQSDYSGGFMVFHGAPTPRTLFTCGPTTLAVRGGAGKTYTIVAFSDTPVNGGNLVLSLEEGPPPPTATVTVDPVGQAYKTGNARVSGTYTCENAGYVELDGQLTQIWRRLKINGYFYKVAQQDTCDGQAHAWTRVVSSDNGTFAGGDATVTIHGFACGLVKCSRFGTTQDITLNGPGHPSLRAKAQKGTRVTSLSASCSARKVSMYETSLACRSLAR